MSSSLQWERLPAMVLLGLAVMLLAQGGWMVYNDFRPTYRLSATPTADVPATADIRAYEDLSPAARTAFENARAGQYVVHHEPSYLETFPLYDKSYVRANGTVYEVWASHNGLSGFSVFRALPMGVLGSGLAVLAIRSYRNEDHRAPLMVLAAVGAVAIAGILGTGPIIPALMATVTVATVTWAGLCWLGST